VIDEDGRRCDLWDKVGDGDGLSVCRPLLFWGFGG
jgi:hypothetical protein